MGILFYYKIVHVVQNNEKKIRGNQIYRKHAIKGNIHQLAAKKINVT